MLNQPVKRLKDQQSFVFSQHSLQDYADCPRRFWLRYLEQLAWPAPPAEPLEEYERHRLLGEQFHRLAHQALLGIDFQLLAKIAESDSLLLTWWENFERLFPSLVTGSRKMEFSLSVPIKQYRLFARFDMIQKWKDPVRWVIWDWKTGDKSPRLNSLLQRWQTRVYRYVLVEAGSSIFGEESPKPEDVEMVYWFAGAPEKSVRMPYSREQFEKDREDIFQLLEWIEQDEEFLPTLEEKRCRFCVYRSFCSRGFAGNIQDWEEEEEVPEFPVLNFDQVSEIHF